VKYTSRFIFCLLVATALAGRAAPARQIEHKERHLGPTGLLGVISASDIEITKVQPGSPADGKLKVGDAIVAAGGIPFKEGTRQQLAAAIDQAETEKAKGVLTLTLKDGKQVDLQLEVLGAYSNTAPYNCPKTDAIVTRAAEALVKSRNFSGQGLPIGLLGLLATGEAKYIAVVREVLHQAPWAKPDIGLSLGSGSAWSWGYTNLLLCEYYLLTGDEFVLPAIKSYSVAIARGRDAAGLWGHGMAIPDFNGGKLHGRLMGYAVMNQSSLPLFISLELAEKCGVRHPEVQAAIEQDQIFYSSFIDKGTLPYGVHEPRADSYNNNGMSGLAAVAFSIHGNTRGAAFFSRMSAAAHNTMETGHTGHYFNQLWTGLGANLAGSETSAAFFKETRWLHTLNRTWDGNFTYDDAGGGIFSYRGLSDAGSHLLNYCLGRHKLFITGRDSDPSIWLKGREVADTIALATLDIKSKSDAELLALLDHPMPKVREEAVGALRGRPPKLVASIRKMVKAGSKKEKLSACGYFGEKCPSETTVPVLDDLASVMRDTREDIEVRAAAANALCRHGEPAYKYYNDMLRIILADEPTDTFGHLDYTVGRSLNTLCNDPYKAGLVKDKDLFYAAANKLLDHKRAVARATGGQLIANIPLVDFHYVADKVRYIMDDKDLTYQSYHNLGAMTEVISILANLNIKGGIEAALATFEVKTGKAGFKIKMLVNILPKYGANAKDALPKIKALFGGRLGKSLDAIVKKIESSTETRKMIGFEEAKQAGNTP